MEDNNLINFDSEIQYKLPLPLIPFSDDSNRIGLPRLSDCDNNPFDKVLREATHIDDPFENVCEELLKKNSQDKENVNVSSPYRTAPSKKTRKYSTSPLYLTKSTHPSSPLRTRDLNNTLLQIVDTSENNDSGLQILSDTVLNEFETSASLNLANENVLIDVINADKSVENDEIGENLRLGSREDVSEDRRANSVVADGKSVKNDRIGEKSRSSSSDRVRFGQIIKSEDVSEVREDSPFNENSFVSRWRCMSASKLQDREWNYRRKLRSCSFNLRRDFEDSDTDVWNHLTFSEENCFKLAALSGKYYF